MTYKIQIAGSDICFEAGEGEKISDAAKRAGIRLPFACGMGACGMCKAHVDAGRACVGAHQPWALSPEAEAGGQVLTCCTVAQSDLVLNVKAERMQPARRKVRVKSIEFYDSTTVRMMLETADGKPLDYKAGQFITLFIDGQPRSYSMASQPGSGAVELHIRHVPGGLFTDRIFGGAGVPASVKAGDEFEFEGPDGDFWLRDGDREVILVCNGTGAAPMIALLEKLAAEGSERRVTMYFGGRTVRSWYLGSRIVPIVTRMPNFRFVQVCSRDPNWPGARGHVQDAVLAEHPDLSAFTVYACGLPSMVADAREAFAAAGLPEAEYYADAFTTAGDAA